MAALHHAPTREGSLADRILGLYESRPGQVLRCGEVAAELDENPDYVAMEHSRLARRGALKRLAIGRYRLAAVKLRRGAICSCHSLHAV